jgi:F-type H+-transporting ATPase subunit b
MFLATSLFVSSASSSALASGHSLGLARFAPKGGVVVDVDLTFLWPIAVFVVLIVVLKPVLFDPMLKLFEERERRIDGAKLAARKMDEASAAALTKYETEMKKARSAGSAEREAQRAEGLKTEHDIVDKVRESTAQTVSIGRKGLQEEAAQARAALQGEAKAIASALASRVLGREVQG